MREILFRGKRVGDNKWVEGYYVKPTQHWHEHGVHDDWIIASAFQNGGYFNVMVRYAVIKETVGQFTGLTDKNEKKIFEGDIVRQNFEICTQSLDVVGYHIGTVRNRAHCGVVLDRPFSYDSIYGGKKKTKRLVNIAQYRCEVIGNIYDNPELLGENKDER